MVSASRWWEEAACSGQPSEWWTEPSSIRWDGAPNRKALAICRTSCPVRAECLAAALKEEGQDDMSHRFTLRGGMTPRQRVEISRKKATR